MLKKKADPLIAITVVVSTLLLFIVLAIVIGRIGLPVAQDTVYVRFPTIAGININTPVRFAGAPAGHVRAIRILPRQERNTAGDRVDYVELTLELTRGLDIGTDVEVTIKQDGVLGSKYIALTPGSPNSPALAPNHLLYGEPIVELMDLAEPAQRLLAEAQPILDTLPPLLSEIQPTLQNLNRITTTIDADLPELLQRLESVLSSSDILMTDLSSPAHRERLAALLRDLGVVSKNLKVISTHSKALTATLGERPWKLIWGGTPNELPTESEILASDTPLPARKAAPTVSKSPPKNGR